MYGDDFVSQQPPNLLQRFLQTFKPNGVPTVPPPNGIPPAVAARTRRDEKRDAQRKIGAQVMDQAGQQPPVAPSTPPGPIPVSATNAVASIDPNNPYEAQAIAAQQAALNAPTPQYQQPQYVPPAKGLEYLALGLTALFPGAPISRMAAGFAQGLQQRADTRYDRATQEAQQKYNAQVQANQTLDRRAQILGQLSNTQESIIERREALREKTINDQNKIADAQNRTQAYIQNLASLGQYRAGALQERIRHDDQVYKAAMNRNAITAEDSIRAHNTQIQIEYMRQAAQDHKYINDVTLKSAAAEASMIGKSLTSQIAAISKNEQDPTAAQTKINALINDANSRVQGLYDKISSTHPELSQMGSLGNDYATQPSPQGYPQAQPYQGGGPQPMGYPSWYATPITGPTTNTQNPPAPHNPAATHNFGTGVTPETMDKFNSYIQGAYQNFPSQQALEDAILTDQNFKGVSKEQMHQMLNTYVQLKGGHSDSSGGLSPDQQQVYNRLYEHLQTTTPGGITQDQADPIIRKEMGLPASHADPQNTEQQNADALVKKLKSEGLSDKVIQNAYPNEWRLHSQGSQHTAATPTAKPVAQATPTPTATPTIGEVATASAKQNGIPAPLVLAVIQNESNGNNSAVSPVGALGFMQLMPETAQGLGVDARNPVQNIAGGAHMLAQLVKKYGDVPTALAAYNWGPGNVDKYGMGKLPPETRAYVQRVMTDYTRMMRAQAP